ncbi:DUF4190 domain-containing protein [Bacillus salacetis]|uniref:DUF4190 domain-containing protein n=1 Tax=Bacillus salacetis TaxID=2315464 RepID=A0A3A1QTI7_9BACI|nr:DUF4190 domain-containing protein [Bacillus salacetis]RIW31036.1 DUF4190 domain-containing protein [Bacillus salacetis]
MDNERRKNDSVNQDLQNIDIYNDYINVNDNPEVEVVRDKYNEETAAELTTPMALGSDFERDAVEETSTSGRILGYAALALSILSLFIVPVLFGAAGIVLGFVARRRGSDALGAWAIGIGAVSIIVGIFVLPFF